MRCTFPEREIAIQDVLCFALRCCVFSVIFFFAVLRFAMFCCPMLCSAMLAFAMPCVAVQCSALVRSWVSLVSRAFPRQRLLSKAIAGNVSKSSKARCNDGSVLNTPRSSSQRVRKLPASPFLCPARKMASGSPKITILNNFQHQPGKYPGSPKIIILSNFWHPGKWPHETPRWQNLSHFCHKPGKWFEEA